MERLATRANIVLSARQPFLFSLLNAVVILAVRRTSKHSNISVIT